MPLYHASTMQYQIGETINHNQGNTCKYYPDVNAELEQVRPHGMLGRDSAIYITNDCAFAKNFISTEYKNIPTFVYEISTPDSLDGHPFAIVHQINKNIKAYNPTKISALAAEYWQPEQYWTLYEYLVSSITIKNIIDVDAFDIMLSQNSYLKDVTKAKSI